MCQETAGGLSSRPEKVCTASSGSEEVLDQIVLYPEGNTQLEASACNY